MRFDRQTDEPDITTTLSPDAAFAGRYEYLAADQAIALNSFSHSLFSFFETPPSISRA